MATHSKYPAYRSKLDSLCYEMSRKMQNYVRIDPETDQKRLKIIFLGLNLYQNGIPPFLNPDILYLYKAFSEAGIEARLHDPHIRGSEALSMGVWMGRHNSEDNWSHSFDVMVLSCPHLFYMQNMSKLANLLKPNKRGLILDLFGAFTRIYKLGDRIDIVTMSEEARKAELMGPHLSRPIINQRQIPESGNTDTE